MRYLIQVQPEYEKEVQGELGALKVAPQKRVMDYFPAAISPEVASRVRALPGVVDVVEDRPIGVIRYNSPPLETFPGPIPIDRKLGYFLSLVKNPITLLEAFNFSIKETTDRWPTGESRKVVGADLAEYIGYQGKGVKVAVIDTGADPLSPQGPYWVGGKSSVEGQPIQLDENGHGTWCGTCVSGRPLSTPWGQIKGVAVDAEVVIFKCLGYGVGMGTNSSVLRSMMDALEWGADIISMSLGGPECDDYRTCPQCRAVKALTEVGIICVVAAGNAGPDLGTLGCPGSSPDALTVGAIGSDLVIAPFSSRGPSRDGRTKPDCVAPGVHTLSSTTGIIDIMQAADGPKLGAISGTCVVGSTEVLTDKGRKKIKDIVVGDVVQSRDGFTNVLAVWNHPRSKVVKLVTSRNLSLNGRRSGRTRYLLMATPEHKIWTRLGWRELSQLIPGEEIATLKGRLTDNREDNRKILERSMEPLDLEPAVLGYIAGYLDGEGSIKVSKKKRAKEKDRAGDFSVSAAFHNTDRASLEFIKDKLGFGGVFSRNKVPKNIVLKKPPKTSYILKVSDKANFLRLLKALTPYLIVKKEKAQWAVNLVAEEIRRVLTSSPMENGQIEWSEVVDVKESGEEPVYDITTDTHSFVANGIIIHNSMATPHVAGLVALMVQFFRAKGKQLTTPMVKDMLARFGQPQDNVYGHGVIKWDMVRQYLS